MNDDPALLRAIIRDYRHTFAEVAETVEGSESHVARNVMGALERGQKRLEKIKAAHPDAFDDPDRERERNHIADVRRFA